MNNKSSNLRLVLKTGIAQTSSFDFSRFDYLDVPIRFKLKSAVSAHRHKDVIRWFNYFKNENEYADTTKWGYLNDFVKFVRQCDKNRVSPETELAVTMWERHLTESVRLGNLHVNSARKLISSIKTIMTRLDESNSSWFSSYSLFRSEINPTQGYSDKELALLLKIILPFFRQTAKQIIDAAESNTGLKLGSSRFKYQGETFSVKNPIPKCFSSAFFLISYYTFANTICILRMLKPKNYEHRNDSWFKQSVLKSRANKYVSIEIGDNGTLDIPKHALSFFKLLLKLSHVISTDDALLYGTNKHSIVALEVNHLQGFNRWVAKHLIPLDDFRKPLRLLNSKFRASGSYRYFAKTGSEIHTSTLLGNTPQVMKRHYATGNSEEVREQLSATVLTLENAAKCSNIEEAKSRSKQQMNLEVLPFEAFLEKYSHSAADKTVIGTGCKSPYSDIGKKYQRKVNFSPKTINVENLACSDIANCFFCKNQVIIDDVDDIWCLLSFKECVLDSREKHINISQFLKNFDELLERINHAVFNLSPTIRRKAQRKLDDYGRHPLWPIDYNFDF